MMKLSAMIWSGEHKAWWRPDAAGYTDDIHAAGRWTMEEAESLTSQAGPEKKIKLIYVTSEWIDGVKQKGSTT